MNAWCRGYLVLVSSLLASCALAAGGDDHTLRDGDPLGGDPRDQKAADVVQASADPAGPGTDPTQDVQPASDVSVSADEPEVPTAAFEDIAALCRAQELMVAPSLRKVELARRAYEAEFSLKPSCTVASASLQNAKISLGGPFLAVSAITANIASGVGTFVVVRTAHGWQALPRASSVASYDDPGCFSIERDGDIAQVRVMGPHDAPALVVLETTNRGHHMEDDIDAEEHPVASWDEVKTHAASCRLAGDVVRCDARQIVRVELVPSTQAGGRTTSVHFGTSYRVDEDGTLRTEATYVGE